MWADADHDRLADEWLARRLLPLLGSRLTELIEAATTEPFGERVAAAAEQNRIAAVALLALTERAVRALEGAGIAALPLKGPLLAQQVHGDLGLRSAADVDLLVAPERLDAAVAALATLGYGDAQDLPGSDGRPELHFRLIHRQLPPIELHWRVHWYESEFGRDMLRRSSVGDDGLRRPERLDGLLALLLYYARDGFHGLRAAADIAAWHDRFGAVRLDDRLDRYPELRPAVEAAALVTDRIAGVPYPSLLDRSPASQRVQAAVRLADWAGVGERDQLAANIALVDGLLGPPGAIPAFVRRQLLRLDPSEERAYSRRSTLWAARGAHAAKMTGRFAIGLSRVRGGRAVGAVPTCGTN